jgi:cell division protease FtsH
MIRVAAGGRAAEEIAFGDMTTGAEGDIDRMTQLARHMVGRWGMSDKVGMVAVLSDGAGPPGADPFSERTRQLVDEEVLRIVDEAHDDALGLLNRERAKLDALAEALLERETLDDDDAYAAAGVDRLAQPTAIA